MTIITVVGHAPSMDLMLFLIAIITSTLLLWRGADAFVDGAAELAKRFGMSELVLGLTLIAFGTSAPEFAVSIGATLNGHADVSVGNIVGSNVFNLGFVLGTAAVIRPILIERTLVYRDGLFLWGVTLLLAWSLRDLTLSRFDGALMFTLLLTYIAALFFLSKKPSTTLNNNVIDTKDANHKKTEKNERDESTEERIYLNTSPLRLTLIILAGLIAVIAGAKILIFGASGIARMWGVSDWAISVTVVAAGTSAPELVTAVNASLKGKHGLSVGGLIGSDIYNLLGVLGVASFIMPMTIDPKALSSVYLLVVMVAAVLLLLRTGWRLTRLEGALLITVNAVRWWFDMNGV